MNAWRVTPPARPASTRVDGFAAAKKARKASAAIGINPVKARRLKNLPSPRLRRAGADCAVCFVFIGLSYGRGAGVGRGRGVSAGLGVEVGVAVVVAVAVALGVAVGVTVAVDVGVGETPAQ